MQALVNVFQVHTNLSLSYVSSFVTPFSSLQSSTIFHLKLILLHMITYKSWNPCICPSCTRLIGTNCRNSFENLHHYHFEILTSRHVLVQDLLQLDFLLLHAFVQYAFCLQFNNNNNKNSKNACHKQQSNNINFTNFKLCSQVSIFP